MYKEEPLGRVQGIGVWVDKQLPKNCHNVILVKISLPFSDCATARKFIIFFLDLGENWFGVDLNEFAGCTSNLAINRQTRMLSDLALVGCYNQSSMAPYERDRIMLASAKRNLAAMSYFGLTEFQKVDSDLNMVNNNQPNNSSSSFVNFADLPICL